MFHLCSVCANTMNQRKCTHTHEERCIVATYVVNEVRKAVEVGCGEMDVFEFWEYEVKCFDKGTNTAGLFSE